MSEQLTCTGLVQTMSELADLLERRGATVAAQAVRDGLVFSVNTGGEFFGEAAVALTRVTAEHGGALSQVELLEVRQVLEGIYGELLRVGSLPLPEAVHAEAARRRVVDPFHRSRGRGGGQA